jgi:hypothetical protein
VTPTSHDQFRVEFEKSALIDLAEAWMAYFPEREGHRMTQAEQILMYLLPDDPHRIVRVTSIGFFHV